MAQGLFQHIHILQSGGCRHVTAVQQDVAIGLLHALGVGLVQQSNQVMNVGVNVAVRQQAQEMHGLAGQSVGNQILPGFGRIQSAVFNGLAHQLGALGVDLTAAQCVVADFGVAHILITGQSNGGAVGLQISMGAGCQQMIQRRSLGHSHSVAAAAVTLADAIHDYQNNGFFHNSIPPKSE